MTQQSKNIEKKLTVKSTTENLSVIRNFIKKEAEVGGFQKDKIDQIILAVDEASTNIIKHAYNFNPEKILQVTIKISGNKFIIEIIDTGNSFDPAQITEPDIKKYVHEHKSGGLGIFLMKKLMDEVKYVSYKNKRNKVTLVKYLN